MPMTNIHSNADSVVEKNGSLVFVEPHETSEEFSNFLDYIQEDASHSVDGRIRRSVKYAQTRTSTESVL